MTNIELILNLFAEATTTEISEIENPNGFLPSEDVAKSGREIAGNTRKNIEKRFGKTVITSKNAKNLLVEKEYKKIG